MVEEAADDDVHPVQQTGGGEPVAPPGGGLRQLHEHPAPVRAVGEDADEQAPVTAADVHHRTDAVEQAGRGRWWFGNGGHRAVEGRGDRRMTVEVLVEGLAEALGEGRPAGADGLQQPGERGEDLLAVEHGGVADRAGRVGAQILAHAGQLEAVGAGLAQHTGVGERGEQPA